MSGNCSKFAHINAYLYYSNLAIIIYELLIVEMLQVVNDHPSSFASFLYK